MSERTIYSGVAKSGKKTVLKQMLGGDIRSVRKDKGLTLEQLADRCGLHSTTIQKIESGEREPRAFTVMKLAKGLGVSPGKLIEGDAWTHIEEGKEP